MCPSSGRRLWVTVALFWLPILAGLMAYELFLWYHGETWPVGRVLAYQRGRPTALFERALIGQGIQAYKHQALGALRPEVVALGSSRVMQFRQAMFGRDGVRFYNAGGLVGDLEALGRAQEVLARAGPPRVVLLGIDLWWLNDAVPFRHRPFDQDDVFSWQAHLEAMRRLTRQWRRFSRLHGSHLGLAARLHGTGFRVDGSRVYQFPEPAPAQEWRFVDHEQPPIAERVRQADPGGAFAPSSGLSPARLARLTGVLARFRQQQVLVIGFAPPLSAEAAGLLAADVRHRRLWSEFRTLVPRAFSDLGYPFVDASTTALLDLDDRYLLDGFHGSETFHAHLLRRMVVDSRVRLALPSSGAAVERLLTAPATTYWHLGPIRDRAEVRPGGLS